MKKEYYAGNDVQFKDSKFSDNRFDGNVFTTAMDPTSQSMKYPSDYPIVSERPLKRVDVAYEGSVTDGDNTPGIAALYRDGPLYHSFDVYTVPVAFQYKGLSIPALPYDDDVSNYETANIEYNDSFARSCVTAISAAYATQLTDLAFLQSIAETNIPGMYEGSEGLIGAIVGYQSVNLNLVSVVQAYFNLMSQVDQLIAVGYNAEAPTTISLTNLLKKANVRSVFEQLGAIIRENYIDQDWLNEIGVIGNIPSREYFDVLSPMAVVSAMHRVPRFKLSHPAIDEQHQPTVYFDSMNPKFNRLLVSLNVEAGNPYANVTYTFEGLIAHILDLLNPAMLLGYCRQVYWFGADAGNQLTPVEQYANYMSIPAYVNDLLASIQRLLDAYAYFSTAMVDLKTFLMLLQDRTDLNGWLIGSTVANTNASRTQLEWFNYELVNQMIDAYFSGGFKFQMDTNTRKWTATSMWDYDRGIPKFDYYEGGISISASVRDFRAPAVIELHNPMYNFPVAFTMLPLFSNKWLTDESTRPEKIYRVGVVYSRRGEHAYLVRTELTRDQISHNLTLARLIVVPSADWESIAAPVMVFDNATVPSPIITSNCLRFMMVEFLLSGYVGYSGFVNAASYVPQHTAEYINPIPSPTAIGLITREFDEFPARSEEYIRSTAPLRMRGGHASMGFILK